MSLKDYGIKLSIINKTNSEAINEFKFSKPIQ